MLEKLDYWLSFHPRRIEQDDIQGGVVQPWVRALPLLYQGTLLSSIRGCDGAPKEDPSKSISRLIRRAIFSPADPRETEKAGGFFGFEPRQAEANTRAFLHSLDQYPLHYVMHLLHATEIIGYAHPDKYFRNLYLLIYRAMCHMFHLNPETHEQMEHRLTLDRILAGTTEREL